VGLTPEDRRARDREYYAENGEVIRAQRAERYHQRKEECPEAIMLESARGRAKRKGLDFNIELSDIVVPSHCPILGYELFFAKEKCTKASPVLDRKDDALGYIKGNVGVISSRANLLKSNMSKDQIMKLAEYTNSGVSGGGVTVDAPWI